MSSDPTAARKPHLTLYHGFPDRGAYHWSPFVTKLELRLRLSGFPYQVGTGSPRTAPKGKIPYVELFSENGETEVLSDSTLISKALVEKGLLPDLQAGRDCVKARDLAIRALCEDRLYFYGIRERWLDNYYLHRDKVLWSVPWPMRVFVGYVAQRNIRSVLHGQGTGRFTDDEIRLFRREIFEAIEQMLEESLRSSEKNGSRNPYWLLGGPRPSEADCSVYGSIVSALVVKSGPVTMKLVKTFPRIMNWARRIHERYSPDYEVWQDKNTMGGVSL